MLPDVVPVSVIDDDGGVGDGDARGGDDGGGRAERRARGKQRDDAGESDDGDVASGDDAALAPSHFLPQPAWMKRGQPALPRCQRRGTQQKSAE